MRTACLPLLLLACVEPFAPDGAQPFTPPSHFRDSWDTIATCANATRNFKEIRWRTVGADSSWWYTFQCPGVACYGRYEPPNRIYITRWAALGDTTLRTVRHEMLHAILRGDSEHRSRYWGVCAPNIR